MSRKAMVQPAQMIAKPAMLRTVSPPVRLPEPTLDSSSSLERCLRMRRSCRDFRNAPVSLRDASQLLWAAQGVTGLGGLRTAPSPGALYAIRPYVISGNITGLTPGIYRFDAEGQELLPATMGDCRSELMKAAGSQLCVEQAAFILLLAANYGRVAREYGARAERLVHIEAGHIAQNVCLEATALGLGVIGLGAFSDADVKEVIGLPVREEPVYLIAAGWKF
jgi:SagB-type dehydrogenase family enzyme